MTDDGGPDEDTALVVAAQRGDGAAFLRLADRYRPRIIGFLARTADPRAVALDELAQQALDDAYEGLPRLRNPGNFRSCLFTIARRRLLDALDAQAHEIPLDNLLVPPAAPAPEPPSDLLDMAATALSGEVIAMLRLRARGYSVAEIAARVGKSPAAVERALIRAREARRILLREQQRREDTKH